MKNKGYVLAETLIVTSFVAGVLIYLLTQLTNLNNNYEKTQNYNKVPNIYALMDIVYYIKNNCISNISSSLENNNYVELNKTLCSGVENLNNIEGIYAIFIFKNDQDINYNNISNSNIDDKFKKFINTIAWEGIEDYRLIAKFEDDSYGTFKF